MTIKTAVTACSVAALLAAAPALAQGPAQRGRGPAAGASPAELQKMFDAYALIQAQDQLAIDDEHYPQFLARFKALQDVRQQAQAERTRHLAELRRLTAGDDVDEDRVRDELHAIDTLDQRTASAVRDAYSRVDEVLSVRQQARFRLFEEQMERQKIDLLMRARQANRRGQAPPP